MTDEETLARRLRDVRERLAAAAALGGYPAPRLAVVTKTHAPEDILPLSGLGVTEIGENYVQELRTKLPLLKEKFRIHMIGRLQSNKIKYIIGQVETIQSVDRWPLAEEISRQAEKRGIVQRILAQISPAGEPQKGGLPPEETLPFLEKLGGLPGLRVCGLMAVMPEEADAGRLESYFAAMRALFERAAAADIPGVRMEELSMGMSGDYELAARHGATLVRVGSAVMGPRDYGRKAGERDNGCQ